MNITTFFDMLRKQGFSTDDIFSIIAYTPIDVNKITKKEVTEFIPGFRVILVKMVEHGQFLDDLFDTHSDEVT